MTVYTKKATYNQFIEQHEQGMQQISFEEFKA